MMKITFSLLIFVLLGCGSDIGHEATFTSLVVQREVCTLALADDESSDDSEDAAEPEEECERYEINTVLRYQIIEDTEKRVWIKGWSINGSTHRNWLGTRDSDGGFLFERSTTTENEGTGCVKTESQTLSLQFPYGMAGYEDADDVCDHLEGRETITVTTTAGCNESGPGTVRTVRKRWEEDPTCEKNISISFSDVEE
ncbi:MAG: hypothetical protein CMH56_12950 [Myxococcales bacterium]|nr:hypothetical protein [Myxococcales bacterium]|tara:strand:+ start:4803 stop:5396 length:594 start_codon:yes stop_codon:yes gene_type:complete